jgi:hypothetical protein
VLELLDREWLMGVTASGGLGIDSSLNWTKPGGELAGLALYSVAVLMVLWIPA